MLHWAQFKCQKLNSKEAKTITSWSVRVFSTHQHCMTHCLRDLLEPRESSAQPRHDTKPAAPSALNESYIIKRLCLQKDPRPSHNLWARGLPSPQYNAITMCSKSYTSVPTFTDGFELSPLDVFPRLLEVKLVSCLALLWAWGFLIHTISEYRIGEAMIANGENFPFLYYIKVSVQFPRYKLVIPIAINIFREEIHTSRKKLKICFI